MANTGFTTSLDMSGIAAMEAQISSQSLADVDEAASALRGYARAFAPVLTGSLAASIYITNGESSDYSSCVGAAESLNPEVKIVEEVIPEFVLSAFVSGSGTGYIAVVGVAAQHGTYQEFGTRYMAPHSFLRPAAEIVRDEFVNSMSNVAG